MAGVGGRSGGRNALPLEHHVMAGTYRPARHQALMAAPPPRVCAPADRARTLRGLRGEARRAIAALIDEFSDWDRSSLATLHEYGRSLERLHHLHATGADARAIQSELRVNILLRKTIGLEAAALR